MHKNSKILEILEKIVGKNYVTDRIEERSFYSSDSSAEKPSLSDYVVMPGSTMEIQKIVRLANQEKIPITPRTGGLTLSGLAIPYGGGILLDLKRMNKIIEINKNSMYAVIECGVTTGQLKTYLEENYPDLWFCIPHAPPAVGVIANANIYGAGQISLEHGLSSDMVNGLEVVLPTGEILKTGSCALGKAWLTKYCLPDFMGLFLGWFGVTGIITKASIQLWPKSKNREAIFYKIDTVDDTVDLLLTLIKSGICEDIYINSWTGSKQERFYMAEKPENYPEIILDVILGGKSRKELKLKKKILDEIIEKTQKEGHKIEKFEAPVILKMGMLLTPMPIPFMDLMKGGGAEYLGCYIPTEATGIAYEKGIEISKKYGFQYIHLVRPLSAGHVTGFMYAFPFDKTDPEMNQKMLKVLEEITEMAILLGGVPWKPSPTVQKVVLKHADPEYITLMKKIKEILDPNKIMAPGQWILEE
ncbi:MAG: FAD-binding oxidoreductase [Candidatus Helarchaeota archaeon]